MQKLLDKTGSIIDNDPWQILTMDGDETGSNAEKHLLVPVKYWQEHQTEFLAESARNKTLGVWFASDEEPENVADYINTWSCIGIHFPTFMDGRGFTLARFIREHYDFKGELRAFGHIIPDQLFFLSRCGFDTFLLDSTPEAIDPQVYFDNFSVMYQACADQPQPLFRRRSQ